MGFIGVDAFERHDGFLLVGEGKFLSAVVALGVVFGD